MIGRRPLLALAAALLAAPPAAAQPAGKVYRIGWLGNANWDSGAESLAISRAFRDELQRRGWVEGRTIVLELRFADGVAERLPPLARELVALDVDVIVASSGLAAEAAKKATATIPIVFASVIGPVERGLVASLHRPGGNLTGFATLSHELIGKRLELLKQAYPQVARVAVLDTGDPQARREAEQAAKALGLQLLAARAQRAEDLAQAIASGVQADAWFVHDTLMHFAERKAIAALIAQQRKPAIYPHLIYVEAGGLMSYAVDLKDQFRRAAGHVDRILRGANPADLPIEQPTTFELVINLKAARALGITIPQSLLLRADKVIE